MSLLAGYGVNLRTITASTVTASLLVLVVFSPVTENVTLLQTDDGGPQDMTVFYVQFYAVYYTPARRAFPLSTYALTANDIQEGDICDDFPGENETCKPKDDIGWVRITFVPPAAAGGQI